MNDYDLMILGAGPNGLTVANAMRDYGYKVAIFERDIEPFPDPRAMAFDDQALRILEQCGVLENYKDELLADDQLRYMDYKSNKPLLTFTPGKTKYGYYQWITFHQVELEKYLRKQLSNGNGVDAFIGWEVEEITDGTESVSLTAKNLETGEVKTFSAPYLVGSDGGQSMVRRTIASGRIDLGYSEDWYVTDTYITDEEYWDNFPSGTQFYPHPEHSILVYKGLKGHVRFDFKAGKMNMQEFEVHVKSLISRWYDVSKFNITRLSPYTFYAGTADTWRKGRLVLSGDAAHLTPPWAGQGLNSGLRDVINLIFKLDLVLKGKANERLLETYQTERLEPAKESIRGAIRSGKMVAIKNPLLIKLRNFFYYLCNRSESLKNYLLTTVVINRPPYNAGLIGNHKLSGSLSIQPEVSLPEGGIRLMDQAIGNGFALLSRKPVPDGKSSQFSQSVGGTVIYIGKDILDCEGKLNKWFNNEGVDCVLLRPDKYVFSAGKNPSQVLDEFATAWAPYAAN
ncbi:MAG: FAD-dependent monooxygenase [Candidatus Thiodiazotropha sp.]